MTFFCLRLVASGHRVKRAFEPGKVPFTVSQPSLCTSSRSFNSSLGRASSKSENSQIHQPIAPLSKNKESDPIHPRSTQFLLHEMDPTNIPVPPQRIIRNAAHFHQLEEEDRAAALNGDNAGSCDDFPDDDAGQVALIDQMLEAMANTDGIIDNDLDNNADVKAIRDLPRAKQERMAWKSMVRSFSGLFHSTYSDTYGMSL